MIFLPFQRAHRVANERPPQQSAELLRRAAAHALPASSGRQHCRHRQWRSSRPRLLLFLGRSRRTASFCGGDAQAVPAATARPGRLHYGSPNCGSPPSRKGRRGILQRSWQPARLQRPPPLLRAQAPPPDSLIYDPERGSEGNRRNGWDDYE